MLPQEDLLADTPPYLDQEDCANEVCEHHILVPDYPGAAIVFALAMHQRVKSPHVEPSQVHCNAVNSRGVATWAKPPWKEKVEDGTFESHLHQK